VAVPRTDRRHRNLSRWLFSFPHASMLRRPNPDRIPRRFLDWCANQASQQCMPKRQHKSDTGEPTGSGSASISMPGHSNPARQIGNCSIAGQYYQCRISSPHTVMGCLQRLPKSKEMWLVFVDLSPISPAPNVQKTLDLSSLIYDGSKLYPW